ncbi:MAG: GTP pyrophosphokinase [Anaerolineae bacterium]|jgi:(p)ppGpp synthase/HD superfamily hydrolase|nr:GTP pyrophosphokinase [Chloroflexota bacterium]MBN8636829.1 GTP pyrophosphokinase [Anaerolineae bacterium]
MPTIEEAIIWATEVHRGQVDKAGNPYILHPLRVMLRMTSAEARFVAILHDTIEDSDHTLDDLRALGYSETIIAAVDAITRRDDETYEEFILRLKPNPLARAVKLADLLDNMDLRRANPVVAEKDAERLARYQRAWIELTRDNPPPLYSY